jgi:hypothetical protein
MRQGAERTVWRLVRVGSSDWNGRVLLQACLVLADHLRDRTHHPEMRGGQVELELVLSHRVSVGFLDWMQSPFDE